MNDAPPTLAEMRERTKSAGGRLSNGNGTWCSYDERCMFAAAALPASDLKAAGLTFFPGEKPGEGRLLLTPEVGMGATFLGWTDREPFFVAKVCTPRKAVLRAAKVEDDPDWKPDFTPGGFVGNTANDSDRKWKVTSNDEGREVTVRLRKDGRWYAATGERYALGYAAKFYDSNF
jgi:hypothetical protein